MGDYTTKITVQVKNEEIGAFDVLFKVTNYRLGPSARFKAKIINATEAVEFNIPTKGSDEEAYPISRTDYKKNVIDFGNAELARQDKNPFFLFPKASLHFPKDRMFFTFPFSTEREFRNLCLEDS